MILVMLSYIYFQLVLMMISSPVSYVSEMTRLWMIFTQVLIHQHLNLLKFNNKLEYLVLWTKWLSISLNDTEININIFSTLRKINSKKNKLWRKRGNSLFLLHIFVHFFPALKKLCFGLFVYQILQISSLFFLTESFKWLYDL